MQDNQDRRFLIKAETAAGTIRKFYTATPLKDLFGSVRVGLILGTGWGDALELENELQISFSHIPGFETLGQLEGHSRRVILGKIDNKAVVALQGRVHLNEGHTPDIPEMVRLQTEMLLQLGVTKLIVTSAVGSLKPSIKVGDLAIVRSFLTLFAPPMPMWAGEFFSPEDILHSGWANYAAKICRQVQFDSHFVTHAMVRGPFFESRKTDKIALRHFGADVVGMSLLPEACVAAVYGAKVLGLGFVTNTASELHSHEENIARTKESKEKLGLLLKNLITNI